MNQFPEAQVRAAPTVTIVIPCYNEEAALPVLMARLAQLDRDLRAADQIAGPLQVLLVDDRSTDRTWPLICAGGHGLAVTGLRLSRNEGKEAALLAGLMQAKGDVVVTIDADLQDDPDAVGPMIDAWRSGAEIVYAVRRSRDVDRPLKRMTALRYYSLMRWLGSDIVPDHADYRLMSRKAIEALSRYGECNIFLRGMVQRLGFATAIVPYDRAPRAAGDSKYSVGKLVALALEGITSFSVRPLRLITWVGFATAFASFCLSLYALGSWLFGSTVWGWTSTVLPMYFLGGVHLIALGIIGEYVGKIYIETKARPRFLIDETVDIAAATPAVASQAA